MCVLPIKSYWRLSMYALAGGNSWRHCAAQTFTLLKLWEFLFSNLHILTPSSFISKLYWNIKLKIYLPVNRLRSFPSSSHLVIRLIGHPVIQSFVHPVIWLSNDLVIWSSDHLICEQYPPSTLHELYPCCKPLITRPHNYFYKCSSVKHPEKNMTG